MIFAGAGRSYDRNVFGILQHETNKATLYVPTIQFWNANNAGCQPGTTGNPFCIEWDDSYLTPAGLQSIAPGAFGEMHLINNNIKAPYADQYSLGMRNRVGDWNTSLSVVRILSKTAWSRALRNFFGDGTWYWCDSGRWSGYDGSASQCGRRQPLPLRQRQGDEDDPGAARTRKALHPRVALVGEHRVHVVPCEGEDRVPRATTSWTMPIPRCAPFVLSNQVPKHRLVAVGSIDGPWGIIFGAKLELETPKPFTAFDQDNFDEPANGFNYNYLKISQFPDRTSGLPHARSAGDEVIRVLRWLRRPGPARRAQRHQSTRTTRSCIDGYPGCRTTSRTGISGEFRARSRWA